MAKSDSFDTFKVLNEPVVMNVRVFRFSITMLIALLAFACSPEKKMKKAFDQGQYQRVINYYLDAIEKKPNDSRANYMVAEAYRLTNRLKESEPFYARAKGRFIDEDTVAFYHAQALKAAGKYDEAKSKLEQLEASTSNEKFKKRITKTLEGLRSRCIRFSL